MRGSDLTMETASSCVSPSGSLTDCHLLTQWLIHSQCLTRKVFQKKTTFQSARVT